MTHPHSLQQKVWLVLNAADPEDRATRLVGSSILLLIALNVLAVIVGSVRSFEAEYHHELHAFEAFSVAIFTVEYLAGVWSCVTAERYAHPIWGRVRFMFSPMALIDLAAILPFFLFLAAYDLRFMRAVRLLRLARLAKLAKYSAAVHLFGRVFINRKEELTITILLMALLVVLSASFIYYAEHEAQPDKFPDIPSAMWWAIVTLTTVGYGDTYPVTSMGKAFAACVSIFGVGMVALPTGILGASFVEELRRGDPGKKTCPHCGKELE